MKKSMQYMTRPALEGDLVYLEDTDIKCCDVPWSQAAWKEVLDTCKVFVAVHRGDVIGLAAFQIVDTDRVLVLKIGVKREHRLQGVSRLLLASGLRVANGRDLEAIVPESTLLPGDPYDLSQWLLKLGFKATTPLLRDHFVLYGEKEDGVRFVLPLRERSSDESKSKASSLPQHGPTEAGPQGTPGVRTPKAEARPDRKGGDPGPGALPVEV